MSSIKLSNYRRQNYAIKTFAHVVLFTISIFCLVPMLLIVSVSFSDEIEMAKQGFQLVPVGFTTFAYEYILQNPSQILTSYLVTVGVTAIGTTLGLLITSLLAYALSRKDYRYNRALSFFVLFTLLFNGGLVPFYIVVTQVLKLQNSVLALILPYIVVPWFVLILRTYFSRLPKDLLDAARIDGAGEWLIFFRIVIPLSKPALAVIGLFFVLKFWNDWFLALLFIEDPDLYPLQFLLYAIMRNIDALASNPQTTNIPIPAQSARMAMAVLAFGPALFSFMLVQKYLVRGITLGGIKG